MRYEPREAGYDWAFLGSLPGRAERIESDSLAECETGLAPVFWELSIKTSGAGEWAGWLNGLAEQQDRMLRGPEVAITTPKSSSLSSAGGVTSGYPSLGMRRARAMLTSWWMLDGTFGKTGPDGGERVDGTETETGGGAFVPVCPQRAGGLISSSRDDAAEIAVDCHAALSRARHFGAGPDSFCSLFVNLSISVTRAVVIRCAHFPYQQQSSASSCPPATTFLSVTSATRVTLAGCTGGSVLTSGPWQAEKSRPVVRSCRAKAGQGWWDLAQLAHPPVCYHQPQNQAIGAANQQLGRAASPTTTPGRRQHKPRQPAGVATAQQPEPSPHLLGLFLGLRRRRGSMAAVGGGACAPGMSRPGRLVVSLDRANAQSVG